MSALHPILRRVSCGVGGAPISWRNYPPPKKIPPPLLAQECAYAQFRVVADARAYAESSSSAQRERSINLPLPNMGNGERGPVENYLLIKEEGEREGGGTRFFKKENSPLSPPHLQLNATLKESARSIG